MGFLHRYFMGFSPHECCVRRLQTRCYHYVHVRFPAGPLMETPPPALAGINTHRVGAPAQVRFNPISSRMSIWRNLVFVALISCILCLLSQSSSAYGPLNHACCVKYTRKPLPFQLIKGYVEQSSREVCRMDAIIFFTVKNKKVCASATDDWVKATIMCLSEKLEVMAYNGTVEDPGKRECQPLKDLIKRMGQ